MQSPGAGGGFGGTGVLSTDKVGERLPGRRAGVGLDGMLTRPFQAWELPDRCLYSQDRSRTPSQGLNTTLSNSKYASKALNNILHHPKKTTDSSMGYGPPRLRNLPIGASIVDVGSFKTSGKTLKTVFTALRNGLELDFRASQARELPGRCQDMGVSNFTTPRKELIISA